MNSNWVSFLNQNCGLFELFYLIPHSRLNEIQSSFEENYPHSAMDVDEDCMFKPSNDIIEEFFEISWELNGDWPSQEDFGSIVNVSTLQDDPMEIEDPDSDNPEFQTKAILSKNTLLKSKPLHRSEEAVVDFDAPLPQRKESGQKLKYFLFRSFFNSSNRLLSYQKTHRGNLSRNMMSITLVSTHGSLHDTLQPLLRNFMFSTHACGHCLQFLVIKAR